MYPFQESKWLEFQNDKSLEPRKVQGPPMKIKSPVKRNKWTNKEMQAAIGAVKSGMGVNAAARSHGVPKTTLKDIIVDELFTQERKKKAEEKAKKTETRRLTAATKRKRSTGKASSRAQRRFTMSSTLPDGSGPSSSLPYCQHPHSNPHPRLLVQSLLRQALRLHHCRQTTVLYVLRSIVIMTIVTG